MNESSNTYGSLTTTTPGVNRRKPHTALFGDIARGIVEEETEVGETQEHSETSAAHDETSSTNSEDCQTEPEIGRKPVGFYERANCIYELGYNGTETYFIRYNFETRRGENYVKEIPINENLVLVPLNDELITKNVVRLPVGPVPYGSEKALYETVRHFIHRYLGVSEFYERLASYYLMFTWVYDRFNTLPYLRALGDYGTGKSRFLQVIGSLCYRPMFASGATTVSPIFRMIDEYRGTLIVDEADFKNSDADAEIIKIFNVGYQKDFPVIRAEVHADKRYKPVAYAVYGPKLIATRKRFTDSALESRCITEIMDFQARPDIPPILPNSFGDEAQAIRNMLLQWRFDKYRDVQLRPECINESIEPRLNQVMMPLASIIEDQTMLNELRKFAERYNKNIIVERGSQIEAEVLQAIIDLAVGGNISPQMKEIADHYNNERDKEDYITPRGVGAIVGNKLRLRKDKDSSNSYRLRWDGELIAKLCEKYGVVKTSAGHSDVSDIL
jgi:hypothetical protein